MNTGLAHRAEPEAVLPGVARRSTDGTKLHSPRLDNRDFRVKEGRSRRCGQALVRVALILRVATPFIKLPRAKKREGAGSRQRLVWFTQDKRVCLAAMNQLAETRYLRPGNVPFALLLAVLLSSGCASTAPDPGADCLVTGDRDLLSLGEFGGCPILSPRQLLDRLRASETPPAP